MRSRTKEKKNEVQQKEDTQKRRWRKRLGNMKCQKKRKNGGKRAKKKVRKEKEMNKKVNVKSERRQQ